MLGLSSGLHYPSGFSDLTISAVNEISDLVGHWDFSNSATLSKTLNWGLGGLTSAGQPQVAVVADELIGTVANGAWYLYDQDNTDLGRCMVYFTTGNQPTYKTGGANGKSYAQFGADDKLAAGSNSWQGAVTGSDLTTVELNFDAMTIFVVAKPSTAETTRTLLYYQGSDVSPQIGNNSFRMYYSMNGGNHRFSAQMNDFTLSDGDWLIQGANQTASDINQVNLHTAWIKPSGQASKIRFNGANSVSGTDNQQTSTNDSNYNDLTSIGMGATFGGNFFTTRSNHWDGDIYEIVYYNKTLSEPEMLAVENHLMSKYGIN